MNQILLDFGTLESKEAIDRQETALTDTLAESPLIDFANPREDYFSDVGHRRMALDMLIDSVNTITKDPQSRESMFERRWLLGTSNKCPVSSFMCFDAVGGGGVDVGDASINFVRALDNNPQTLSRALSLARKKISQDDFDYESDPQGMDHNLSVSYSVGRSQARQSGG